MGDDEGGGVTEWRVGGGWATWLLLAQPSVGLFTGQRDQDIAGAAEGEDWDDEGTGGLEGEVGGADAKG